MNQWKFQHRCKEMKRRASEHATCCSQRANGVLRHIGDIPTIWKHPLQHRLNLRMMIWLATAAAAAAGDGDVGGTLL